MSTVRVAQNFREALMVQSRVIYALMLRETKTVFGRSKFGYLWVIIQTAFSVCVIWAIRGAVGAMTIPGLELPVFLICGFTCWNTFSATLGKVMVAVDSNRSLLYFSKVRNFDLVMGRSLLLGGTNIVVMVILMLVVYLAGFVFPISNLWPFFISYTLLLLMGLGLGLMCCALKRYSESVQVVVSMVLRIGIFTSGVMFSFSRLPHELMFLVRMNPILQLIEYSRTSFSYTYQGGKFINFPLVLITTLVVLFLGTFLEIATRNKRDVV